MEEGHMHKSLLLVVEMVEALVVLVGVVAVVEEVVEGEVEGEVLEVHKLGLEHDISLYNDGGRLVVVG